MKTFGITIITLFIILAATLLSGCASNEKRARIDSHEWIELKCSGILSWANCNKEAMAYCPNGYFVKDALENVTIQRREMSVACKS